MLRYQKEASNSWCYCCFHFSFFVSIGITKRFYSLFRLHYLHLPIQITFDITWIVWILISSVICPFSLCLPWCVLIFEDWCLETDTTIYPQQTRLLCNSHQNLFDIRIKWCNLCDVDPSSLSIYWDWGSYGGYLVCVSSSIIVHHFYLDAAAAIVYMLLDINSRELYMQIP